MSTDIPHDKRIFRDRREAGRLLAERLAGYRDQKPIVLALPRGGVVVGYEIARALGAPLDVVVARKLGAPWQPEGCRPVPRERADKPNGMPVAA